MAEAVEPDAKRRCIAEVVASPVALARATAEQKGDREIVMEAVSAPVASRWRLRRRIGRKVCSSSPSESSRLKRGPFPLSPCYASYSSCFISGSRVSQSSERSLCCSAVVRASKPGLALPKVSAIFPGGFPKKKPCLLVTFLGCAHLLSL